MQAVRAGGVLLSAIFLASPVLAQERVPEIRNRVEQKADVQISLPPTGGKQAPATEPRGQPNKAEVTFPPTFKDGPHLAPMNAKEKRALKLSKARINEKLMPTPGADGSVVYMYGHAEPFLVCAPGRWCAIRLAPGEIITGGGDGILLTDSVNWWAKPMAYGSRSQVITDVMVSPKYGGTQAQIAFGTNKGRRYVVGLRSHETQYVHVISFSYPDDEVRQANAAYGKQVAANERGGGGIASDVDIAALDFAFDIDGDEDVRPMAVYTDGKRTIIDFGRELSEMPVVVGLGDDGSLFSDPTRYVLNVTPLSKSRLLVDAPLERAAVVSGIGSSGREARIERRR